MSGETAAILPGGQRLEALVEALTGAAVSALEPIRGGDVGRAWCARLASGERVFAKHYPDAPGEAVVREAEGLGWLAEPDVVPVPRVLGVDAGACLLVLEWIEPGRADPRGDAALGRALAGLHRSGADRYGALPDNFIGRLRQSNAAHARWAEFYAEERILPLVRRARDEGRLDARDAARADALAARLGALFGDEEPPSRLHGDLWGGNRLCDRDGRSWLIDPAAYGGHREMDLAMMQLFSGFSEAVFAAYREVFPLAPGASERVPLCQLYPLLVHVNLFGGRYAEGVRRILDRYF